MRQPKTARRVNSTLKNGRLDRRHDPAPAKDDRNQEREGVENPVARTAFAVMLPA